jgi:ParB-like nuclease domain
MSKAIAVINSEYRNLPLAQLQESPTNPRRRFNEQALAELAANFATQGVVHPLVVRAIEESKYEVVAGARRFRAAQLAALKEVPVVVRVLSDAAVRELQLTENLLREDVHPYEEALGSLVELHPDNRVVELSFVSFIPFILCRGRSLSEPAVLRRRTNASCGFTLPRAV